MVTAGVSHEVKNEVDAKVKELFGASDSDQSKWGVIVFCLATNPTYYSGLAIVKDVPPALKAFLDTMLHKEFNPPAEEGAQTTQTPDEAEMMLKECKDTWGTEIQRLEDAGIVSAAMTQGLKKCVVGVQPGAAAACTVAMNASVAAMNRALLHTAIQQWSGAASLVAQVSGNPVQAVFLAMLSDGAESAAIASRQLALRMETVSTVCKWTSRAGVVLTVGVLGYELYDNIRKYWKGEIDGYTCAENLTTSFGTAAAGFAGAAGAVALCAGAGPWGLVFAGVAGAVLASGLTTVAVKAIFQGLFGTDRDRALTKAYGVLGLESGASPHEVRQAYLTRAKETHPDKGGDQKEFIKINSAYELIRASMLAS